MPAAVNWVLIPDLWKVLSEVLSYVVILIQQLEEAMRPDTSLVSIMTVNNEIGVKQPVKEIGKVLVEKTNLMSCSRLTFPVKAYSTNFYTGSLHPDI